MKNKNYLDYIPRINQKWKETDKGNIELAIENKGLCNRLTQKLLCKPQISYISLDKYGSFMEKYKWKKYRLQYWTTIAEKI